MTNNPEINQKVGKDFYSSYDDLNRFLSYFYQIKCIRSLKPNSLLEVGIGDNTLSSYLKSKKMVVTTCDFDETLQPDVVADVRNLPFKNNEFECVVAFEILEHLPYSDFNTALREIHRVSAKYAIISLPYSGIYLEILIRFPFIEKIIKKPFLRLFLSFPSLIQRFKGEHHYWEVGNKGYSRRKIKHDLRPYFTIIRDFRPAVNTHHYFLVLRKKED